MAKPLVLDPSFLSSCSEEEYQAAREFGSGVEHFVGGTLRGGWQYLDSFYFTGRISDGHRKIPISQILQRRK